jgi:hypothetical protein
VVEATSVVEATAVAAASDPLLASAGRDRETESGQLSPSPGNRVRALQIG